MEKDNQTTEPLSAVDPVLIPHETLSAESLNGVIESFILREGTDYGVEEIHFEKKFAQILRQLEKKEIVITFDPATESVHLLTHRQWRDLTKGK